MPAQQVTRNSDRNEGKELRNMEQRGRYQVVFIIIVAVETQPLKQDVCI